MNLKEIKELIELMNDNELSEFELERDGIKIKLVKGKGLVASQIAVDAIPIQTTRSETSGTAPQQSELPANTIEIKSPMVGTFYRSPAPDTPPFVEAGQEIEPGQSVCIIEAMKLMNEIKSDHRGKVVKVLVENAEPVEYNQPLFLVELA